MWSGRYVSSPDRPYFAARAFSRGEPKLLAAPAVQPSCEPGNFTRRHPGTSSLFHARPARERPRAHAAGPPARSSPAERRAAGASLPTEGPTEGPTPARRTAADRSRAGRSRAGRRPARLRRDRTASPAATPPARASHAPRPGRSGGRDAGGVRPRVRRARAVRRTERAIHLALSDRGEPLAQRDPRAAKREAGDPGERRPAPRGDRAGGEARSRPANTTRSIRSTRASASSTPRSAERSTSLASRSGRR